MKKNSKQIISDIFAFGLTGLPGLMISHEDEITEWINNKLNGIKSEEDSSEEETEEA